jgi:type IV fimbrial biogenesis protein FimT
LAVLNTSSDANDPGRHARKASACARLQNGFTLVELMVGIVVVGILFALSAPSFRNGLQSSQVRTSAESILNGLQLARSEAVGRNTTVQFTLSGTTNVNSSWTVACANAVADLNGDGKADCPGAGLVAPLSTFIQQRSGSESTPNAVVNTSAQTVTFTGLGRAQNSMTLNVTNPTGGTCARANGPMRCMCILVSTGGQARMCDPNLANTDPQGCPAAGAGGLDAQGCPILN